MASYPGYMGPMGMRSPIFGTPQAPANFLGFAPQVAPQDLRRKQQIQGVGDTLTQLGIGLMGQGPSTTPQSPLQGLAQGLQGANAMSAQRGQEAQDERRMQMAEGQFGMQQQQFMAEQQKLAQEEAYKKAKDEMFDRLIAGLPPDMQDAARADKDTFFKAYAESKFPKPEGPQSSIAKLSADLNAGRIGQAEYDAAVRKETYITPQVPRDPERTYKDLTDAKGNVIGQVDDRGKKEYFSKGITVSPDGTIQIGGSGDPNATEAQNAKQGTLIKTGLDTFAKVNMANINPAKMAAVGAARAVGGQDIGALAQTYGLNADEQNFVAARGAISEAVTAAITGAAYAPEQLRNYQNVFVPAPGEPFEVTQAKLQRSAIFLQQLEAVSGGAMIDTLSQDVVTKAAEMAMAAPLPGAQPAPGGPALSKEERKKKYGLK